jgi:hypothetical protein
MNVHVNRLYQAALDLQKYFEDNNLQFAFIGGLANLRWGIHRTTNDVDATLLTHFTGEENIVKSIMKIFPSRIPDGERFALTKRVLLLKAPNNVEIDISLGGLPFEQKMIERSTYSMFEENVNIRTCSAEDLIVMKMFASRPLDIVDVEGILIRQYGKLDMGYIHSHLYELAQLKEEPELVDQFKTLVIKLNIKPVRQ